MNEPPDLSPDAASELRLLRAEIAALRAHVASPPPWTRGTWLPKVREGHLEASVRHRQLRGWLHRRAHAPLLPVAANKQRQHSLWLLVTTLVRVAAWTILIACVAAGIAHGPGFAWARSLSQSIPFVALISLYANWATDFGAAIASYAALVAADVHHQVAAARTALGADLAEIQADIDRIAELQGDEAAELAAMVKAKLVTKL